MASSRPEMKCARHPIYSHFFLFLTILRFRWHLEKLGSGCFGVLLVSILPLLLTDSLLLYHYVYIYYMYRALPPGQGVALEILLKTFRYSILPLNLSSQ